MICLHKLESAHGLLLRFIVKSERVLELAESCSLQKGSILKMV